MKEERYVSLHFKMTLLTFIKNAVQFRGLPPLSGLQVLDLDFHGTKDIESEVFDSFIDQAVALKSISIVIHGTRPKQYAYPVSFRWNLPLLHSVRLNCLFKTAVAEGASMQGGFLRRHPYIKILDLQTQTFGVLERDLNLSEVRALRFDGSNSGLFFAPFLQQLRDGLPLNQARLKMLSISPRSFREKAAYPVNAVLSEVPLPITCLQMMVTAGWINLDEGYWKLRLDSRAFLNLIEVGVVVRDRMIADAYPPPVAAAQDPETVEALVSFLLPQH